MKPRSVFKVTVIFVAGFAVLYAGVAGVSALVIRSHHLPRILAQFNDLVDYEDAIVADLELLSRESPFPETTFERNAEPYLERYVNWQEHDARPAIKALRELKTAYREWIKNPQQREALIKDPRFVALDTEWLEELHDFDHWNFSENALVKEPMSRVPRRGGVARLGVFATLPIPEFGTLAWSAELHVLKSHLAGDPERGLRTYRKAAQLIHTAGTLISNMTAASMLKRESKLVEALKIQPLQLSPLRADVVSAYRRIAWAWAHLIRMGDYGIFPRRLEPYLEQTRTAFCGGVWENIVTKTAFEKLLRPKSPLEWDFKDQIDDAKAFIRPLVRRCGYPIYDAFLSDAPDDGDGPKAWLGVESLPFVRRYIALSFLEIANNSGTKFYEEDGIPRGKSRSPSSGN